MNVFCVHSLTLCGGNPDIVYILYQIIYLCHLARLSWSLSVSVQCLLILFVCHRILCDTWSHSSSSQKSWEQKNKTTKKNNRNTSSFKKFYPNSLSLFNHESSSLTLFHSNSFPLWQKAAAYLYKFVLLIVIVGLCSISPGSRICSQLCADKWWINKQYETRSSEYGSNGEILIM